VIPPQQSEPITRTKNWKVLLGLSLLILVILLGVLLWREKGHQINSEQLSGITPTVELSTFLTSTPTVCTGDSGCALPEMPVGLH
jgi:hypothetical protein